MKPRQYFVYGLPLANVGGQLCECCGRRGAVSRSVSMLAICGKCAGDADYAALVMAEERRASEATV